MQAGTTVQMIFQALVKKSILAYIDSGIPVCIWSTIEMRPVVQKSGWYLETRRSLYK